MTTSDTPRTDFEFPDGAYLQGDDVRDFARMLERELTAEREKNARLREEVLEEAAKVCDGMGPGNQFYQDCSFNIRAMKEKQ